MKIFKNRGDIYLSKSRTGADREQHILLGILAAVLLVSVVVVLYVGAKNDFPPRNFLPRHQTVAISQTADDTTAPPELPRVSGKPIICWRLPAKIIKICMRLCSSKRIWTACLIKFAICCLKPPQRAAP